MQASTQRLGVLLLASAGLHAGLLALARGPRVPLPLSAPTLQVVVAHPAARPNAHPARPRPVPHPEPRRQAARPPARRPPAHARIPPSRHPVPRPDHRQQDAPPAPHRTLMARPATRPAVHPVRPRPAPPRTLAAHPVPPAPLAGQRVAADRTAQRAWARRQLALVLRSRFRYPLLARRLGWEGQVVLDLQVAHSGRVRVLRVAASSGHAVLDQAARHALDAARIPGAAAHLRPDGLRLELTVEYRLVES